MKRYDILEFVSQRKNGEMPPENDYMVHIANVIRRTTCNSRGNEAQTQCCSGNVADLNDSERRCAERWAKENNLWLLWDLKKQIKEDTVIHLFLFGMSFQRMS